MNVHLTPCNDLNCRFHEYPYKAKPPLANYREQLFRNNDDIFKIIKLLIKEVCSNNERGKKFDVSLSVAKQIPFFCCTNRVLSKDYQKAIERYVFCNETSTQAYLGAYGQQPYRWIQMYFIIKQAFALKEQELIKKQSKNNGSSR